MRLITHNLIQCHVKNCTSNNFPLQFEEVEVESIESEFNADFLVNFLPRIDYDALVRTSLELGITSLPSAPPSKPDEELEFLQALHHVLMEVKIENGQMRCRNCQRVYPIKDGIANMLLHEDEVK